MHAISDGPEDNLPFFRSMCEFASCALPEAHEAFGLSAAYQKMGQHPIHGITTEVTASWQFLECPRVQTAALLTCS